MLILVSLIFLSIPNLVVATCPNDTVPMSPLLEGTYSCLKLSTDKRSFAYAEQVCGTMKGHLMTISNGFVAGFIAIVLTSLSISNSVVATCPNDTIAIPQTFESNYNCVSLSIGELDFSYAEKVCGTMKGHLLSVPNGYVNTFIADVIQKSGINDGFFLGVTDLFGGIWRNLDDGSEIAFTNWAPGFPPNSSDPLCVHINGDGLWRTENCVVNYHYLCGIPDYSVFH
ncbi:hypothetical protein FO519_001217 [Halicephalobus sp. NKZ332]|nr:hypothetical protein FO519_001217 [Halicephalobus sp. NKZ332]